MPYYRKKPVVIEAIQYTGPNIDEIREFVGDNIIAEEFDIGVSKEFPADIQIRTLEGVMTASRYDYIIKGIKGEYYPCKPDVFHKTYDPALDYQWESICPRCGVKLQN